MHFALFVLNISFVDIFRAVHSRRGGGGGEGGSCPCQEKRNVFFCSNIVFDFAGLFLVAYWSEICILETPACERMQSLPLQIKNPRCGPDFMDHM